LSVLNQGYPNLEYIIIDGGSTDNTLDILGELSSRLSYWVSEPDGGQSDAINKGFKRASGEIVTWLNSDDYYTPGTLKNVAGSFAAQDVKAVTSVVRNIDASGACWDELTPLCDSPLDYLCRTFNNQPGTFFRRDVWDRYFPLPENLRFTMDQYLWFCFWLEHDVHEFKREHYTTAVFRRHEQSKTSGSLTTTVFNSLGKSFFNEHNLIFWSYVNQFDPDKAGVIESYFYDEYDPHDHPISFPMHLDCDEADCEPLFQRYLFQLLKEDYRQGSIDRFVRNASWIKKDFLDEGARSLLSRMKAKTFSPGVLKLYRTMYWKIRGLIPVS